MPFPSPLPTMPDLAKPVIGSDGKFTPEWALFLRALMAWLKAFAASV